MVLDLARAWRESFFALLGLNEIEDVPLTISQHVSWLRERARCASSNEHSRALDRPAFAQLRRGRQLEPAFFQQSLPAGEVADPIIEFFELWQFLAPPRIDILKLGQRLVVQLFDAHAQIIDGLYTCSVDLVKRRGDRHKQIG